MRRLIFIFLLLPIFSFSQKDYNIIRDNKKSFVVGFSDNDSFSSIYNAFGVHTYNKNMASWNRYSYTAQEYNTNLGLFFFPKRTYDARNKSFLQVDPQSQFFSPYTYTNGDPVNHIDYDGAASKPLILYGENHARGGLDAGFRDFISSVKDAHYVSLSEFMTHDRIKLDDWNGNVYIEGHMSPDLGKEVTVEIGSKPSHLRAYKKEGTYSYKGKAPGGEELYTTVADAETMGKRLFNLSRQNRVDLKNIVAGGCEGAPAAERMAHGYLEAGGRSGFKAMGFREGWIPGILGEKSAALHGAAYGAEHSRMFVLPAGFKVKHETRHFTKSDGSDLKIISDYSVENGGKNMKSRFFMEGQEIDDFVNGAPSRSVQQFMKIMPY